MPVRCVLKEKMAASSVPHLRVLVKMGQRVHSALAGEAEMVVPTKEHQDQRRSIDHGNLSKEFLVYGTGCGSVRRQTWLSQIG